MSGKTIEIQFIPKVKISGIPIKNLKTDEIIFTSIDNLFEEGEILSVDIKVGANWEQGLIDELRDSILDRLEYAGMRGFDYLGREDLTGSPPLISMIDDAEQYLRDNYGGFGGITAEYFIYKEGKQTGEIGNPIYTPLNRIFLSAPPTIKYDTCEYFSPDRNDLLTFNHNGKDIEASCGFQYFYQTWKSDSMYAKFLRAKGDSGRRSKIKEEAGGGFVDTDFEKIRRYCDKKPPEYDDWWLLYKDFINKKNLDNAIIKPVEDSLADKLVESIPEIKLLDLSPPKYSDLDTKNSMSILDIVRLCMWMGISLNIYDQFGELLLVYDKTNDFHTKLNSRNYNDYRKRMKIKRGRVVLKIVDNHGYFVSKGSPEVASCSQGGTHGWGGFYPCSAAEVERHQMKGKEKNITDIDNKEAVIIKHPKTRFHQKELDYKWDGGWKCATDLMTYDKYKEVMKQKEAPYCKEQPPPTPDELISMMKTGAIYYVGKTKLNGIVNYLQRNKSLTSSIEFVDINKTKAGGKWKIVKSEIKTGIKANNLRGMPTTIHKATYGKLKLYAYHQHPQIKFTLHKDCDGMLVYDDDKAEECINKWKEDFPILKRLAIPTPTSMGQAIFDSLNLDCYSCMNDAVKNIFFTGETKPDYRRFPETHDNACAFSLDFSKAYSNAARFMDVEWSVLDAIDEPKRFGKNSTFIPNAFYLVRELETGFPYKDLEGSGMVLYHGCLLRHLVGKVKIEYIINSHKKLEKDYFVGFVDKCIEIAGDGMNNVVSAKQLVNNTFGNLKNKDGIRDYKLFVNSDKIEKAKSFARGQPVYNLKQDEAEWKGNSFITAKGYYEHHFLTGQPIRLQIMERINELNLLLDSAVRKSLNRDINLILVKTDALYYQYPSGEKYSKKKEYWKDFKFRPNRDLNIEDINSELPEGYEVKIEIPSPDSNGKPIEVNEYWANAPDKLNQLPIPSYWKKDYLNTEYYNDAWDKDTMVEELMYKYWKLGGVYCKGEGGVGKTEIIKGIAKGCSENRMRLKWVKLAYKYSNRDNYIQKIKDWKIHHPCSIRRLAPTNKACNNIGGMTLHRSLGLRVMKNIDDEDNKDEEEEEEKKQGANANYIINKMMDNPPDIIGVDEISMIGGEGWSILSYIKQRCPEIRFFLFGDIAHQLPPVGEEERGIDDGACMKELVGRNKIVLNYNFRRGCAGSNTLWEKAAHKPKTFKLRKAPLTMRNLCWMNKTRKEVIDLVQNNHPNPMLWLDCGKIEDPTNTGQNEKLMLSIGTPLIARKSIKRNGVAKNEIWKVCKIEKRVELFHPDTADCLSICLKYKDREEWFSQEEIILWWLSAYCITIHKSQGDTYRDEYTIWDWNIISKRNDPILQKLRYTAVSRSVDYEKLVYFK